MKNASFLSAWLLAMAASLPSAALAQTTPLSRAEVKAEYLRARTAGELPSSADLFGPALQQAMQPARTKPAGHSTTKAMEAEQRSPPAALQSTASAAQR